jgi:hypothetical protein
VVFLEGQKKTVLFVVFTLVFFFCFFLFSRTLLLLVLLLLVLLLLLLLLHAACKHVGFGGSGRGSGRIGAQRRAVGVFGGWVYAKPIYTISNKSQ